MDRLEDVFNASYRRLVGQLYAVCGDLGEAEEVVAEAFVRAAARRRSFDRLDNPEAWLRTVAVNLARSRFRRTTAGRRAMARLPGVDRQPELSPDRLALVAALRRLPAGQRQCLGLHYLADLSVQEVSDTLSMPVGTVKSNLLRGRRALAALLDDDAPSTREGSHV